MRLDSRTISLYNSPMVKAHIVYGIILAAGKGTRFKAKGHNKTAALFQNKPLVYYGVSLLASIVDKTYVVIGAYADSVKNALKDKKNVIYTKQYKRLGTGHALLTAMKAIETSSRAHPSSVVVGYGDHMMFYTKDIVKNMVSLLHDNQAAITFISTHHEDPNTLAWGRIKRDKTGKVIGIVEQKDATEAERAITELNAGFYCFDYNFLRTYAKHLRKSPVTGEYYLTDFIDIAVKHDLPVEALQVPFEYVGIGINSITQLEESISLYSTIHSK